MEFRFNAEKMNSVFMIPAEIADKHLKLAGALQLRVILYCYRNITRGIIPSEIATALSVSEEDVNDALMFWSEIGLIIGESNASKPLENEQKNRKVSPSVAIVQKPTRTEVIKRGSESPEIAFMLNEAQKKFGRMLKQSESSVLVWIYDDLGMDASLVLMVVEYAIQMGKCNISYIEKVARDWCENGIENIAQAEQRISELNNSRSAWNIMRSAFGLDMRAPSDAELKLAVSAVLDWGMSKEMLKKAYDICIDSIGKYKSSYIKTVLTSWHKAGYKTLSEVSAAEDEKSGNGKKQVGKSVTSRIDKAKLSEIIDGD